jgi:hypothetical protein
MTHHPLARVDRWSADTPTLLFSVLQGELWTAMVGPRELSFGDFVLNRSSLHSQMSEYSLVFGSSP